MHAFSLLALALVFSAALVAAESSSPALMRRQVNPLSLGLGASAVHKQRANHKVIETYRAELDDISQQVAALKATELSLQSARLQRRQLGTVLGATGIQKSKRTRKDIAELNADFSGLRHEVDVLLQQERLSPATANDLNESGPADDGAQVEEAGGDRHRLVRRQLGMILAPVAMHKARNDRKTLVALGSQIQQLKLDCGRVKAAQDTRLLTLKSGRSAASTTIVSIHLSGGNRNRRVDNGVLSSSEFRGPTIRGPTVVDDDEEEPSDATYGKSPSPSTYRGQAPARSSRGRPSTYGPPKY